MIKFLASKVYIMSNISLVPAFFFFFFFFQLFNFNWSVRVVLVLNSLHLRSDAESISLSKFDERQVDINGISSHV